MAKGLIETPTRDEGEINFNTDFGTGKIAVTVRPPLSITKYTVDVSMLNMMEIFAKILLESCKLGKMQAAAFAQKGTAEKTS